MCNTHAGDRALFVVCHIGASKGKCGRETRGAAAMPVSRFEVWDSFVFTFPTVVNDPTSDCKDGG